MEEEKSMCKEGRKKITVSIGGGGIGGVVLLGGALAAATLIAAAFTMKRSWGRRPSNKDQQLIPTTDMCKKLKKINEDEGREGLRSLLQTSSPSLHPNPCCRSDGKSEMDVTQFGSLELVSTQSLLSEEKLVLMLEINGEKETLLCGDEEVLPSNYSKPGNIPAIKVKKEDEACETIHAEQMEEDPTMQSVEEEDSEEDVDDIVGYAVKICIERLEINFQNSREKIVDTPFVEAIEMKKDEVCETVRAEKVKEDPPKQSVEDDVDDDEGGIVVEKGKESLEGMGDSLIESIVKPVWPTESIERLEINFQNAGEKIDDAPYVEAIEVKKEDEVLKTACPEQVEEDPPMQSVEDDDEGGIVLENGKESLEGMGDSLIESIMKPVWPTESIERLEINFQNSGEKIDDTLSVEAIEVKKEDEVLETACPEQVEEDPPLQSIEDVVDDDEGEIVAEKVKESLEGMGDSLIESIVKPVWPTESIDRLEINFQNSGEKIDDTPSVEAIEVKKEDEVLETAYPEQVEEDPPMQSVEDDAVDDDEGEIVAERGKESLEGMGDSLTESIPKLVWPTEPIERLKVNFQNSGEKIEDASSAEDIDLKKEDEAYKTIHGEQMEEDPSMKSIEVEDEEDDDKGGYVVEKGEENSEDLPLQSIQEEEEGDYVIEKGEESSEGTEDSSMESNTELVWPTESIERLSLEFKEMKFNFQNSEKKIEEDIRVKKEDDSSNNSRDNGNTYDLGNNNKEIARKSTTNSNKIRETSELVKVNDQPPNSAKWRIWIWSVFVLVILLLLLSLTRHEAMSRYLLNDDSFIIP